MKRYKKLIILGAILLAAIIAVVVITQINVYKEKIDSTVETIITIDPDEVTSLSWNYGEEGLSFHKDSESEDESDDALWLYDEDSEFPVDASKISELLSPFEEFETEFTIEDVEDYAQYGLDEPMCTVTIVNGDETLEVKFGNYSTMDEERYVSIGDGKVYLASVDPTENFDIELKDMIKNDEIPSLTDPSDISFAGSENYSIYRDESGKLSCCLDDVYFRDEEGETQAFDTDYVENLLSEIEGLDEGEYVTYNATDEEISKYGLDSPDLTTTVTYVSESEDSDDEEDAEKTYSTFEISFSKSDEVTEEKETTTSEEETDSEEADSEEEEESEYDAYVRIGDSKIIYKISSSDYEALTAVSYDDLRHTNVYTAGTEQMEGVDVTLNGEDYSFVLGKSKDEDSEDEDAFFYNDEEIDFSDFETYLEALVVNEFTDEEPEKDEEISLKIKLSNDNFPEVDIELYTYDGTNCLAVLDGKTLGLVSRASVVSLIESVNELVLN